MDKALIRGQQASRVVIFRDFARFAQHEYARGVADVTFAGLLSSPAALSRLAYTSNRRRRLSETSTPVRQRSLSHKLHKIGHKIPKSAIDIMPEADIIRCVSTRQ